MTRDVLSGWLRAATAFCLIGATLAGVARAQAAPGVPNLSGIWWADHPDTHLQPEGGGALPFTAKGLALYTQSAAATKSVAAGPTGPNDLRRCLPLGPTRILEQNFPFEIFQQGKDGFFIVYEHNHVWETVYLNEQPDPNFDPAYMGYSVGHYTKDGIEISTNDFNDETVLDNTGVPHSDQLSVVRDMRTIDHGKTLEIRSTITDPVVFTRPFSVVQTFRRRTDASIEEYTCGQGPTLDTRYGNSDPD